jgi:hypothetical protein
MVMRWSRRVAYVSEATVQQQIRAAYKAFHIATSDLSQGRATRQTDGLPDLYCWSVEARLNWWLECKRPYIRGAQAMGKRSWEQEQWHREALAAGIHVATVDSVECALAYAAYLGVPLPAGSYRQMFDPSAQVRFYDPRAKPRVLLRRGRVVVQGE